MFSDVLQSHSKPKFSEDLSQSDFLNVEQSENYVSESENHKLEKMTSSFLNGSCLKKFQSCFAVVRKDSNFATKNDIFQFGSSSTLPGVVELDDYFDKPVHRKQAFANRINRFWNASFQLSDSHQHVKFVEYCNHFLVQMRKFILKLRNAVKDEDLYLEQINKVESKFFATKSHKNSRTNDQEIDDCNFNNVDDDDDDDDDESCLQYKVFLKCPMKLGKVYAELQMHFKTWNDILENWHASR